MESVYSISFQKECKPKVNSEEFGAYANGSTFITIPVPLVQPDDKQGFWEFARA